MIESCWQATSEPRRWAGASCGLKIRDQDQLSRIYENEGAYLSNVHGSGVGQGANREPGNGATAEQVTLVLRAGLQRGAEAEGDRVPLDVATTTLPANERAVDEGAEPGGEQEGRHPPSLRGRKERGQALHWEAARRWAYLQGSVHKDARERGAEALEDEDISDDTLVVTAAKEMVASQPGQGRGRIGET